jgi:hypothetical protein
VWLLLAMSGLLRAVLIPFRVVFGSFWINLDLFELYLVVLRLS